MMRDVTEQGRAEQALALVDAATTVVSLAPDLDSAAGHLLEQIGRTAGWAVGLLWLPTPEAPGFRAVPAHYAADPRFEAFVAANAHVSASPQRCPPFAALPVAGTMACDLADYCDCRRARAAVAAGLRRAVAIPVLAGGDLLAVMEFFTESPAVDDPFVAVATGLGRQLGDVLRRKQVEADLVHQTLHDRLTGLPNRSLFTDRLAQALGRLRRRPGQVGVMSIDLDGFKLINENLSHEVGDRVLVAVAERVSSVLRADDTVSRLAGDEFAVACEDVAGTDVVMALAERLVAALRTPVTVDGHELVVTASVGVAATDDVRTPAADLLRRADLATHRAKEAGRNQAAAFDPDGEEYAVHRLRLVGDLRGALDRGELRVVFQPVVSLRDGSLAGVESLLRWDHPQLGPVAPVQFVPLAEETGLIVPIGAWVLEEACRTVAGWNAAHPGASPLGVAVNVSPRQLLLPNLAEVVAAVLAATGLEPSRLCLEITESAFVANSISVMGGLHALDDLGVRLAIDDFGTGYSSLAYLRRFPVDVLKIDRALVSPLGADPLDAALPSAVIAMAQSLGLGTVAEGVESEEQLGALVGMGCDAAQGFLLGRPVESEELAGCAGRLQRWRNLVDRGNRPPAAAPMPPGPDRTGPRVLLVEDNLHDADLVGYLLRAARYEVLHVADPCNVADALSVQRPDLVLMDLRLPGRTGHAVAREIAGYGATPIVALTAFPDWVDIEPGLFAGVVRKPVDPNRLVATIEELMAGAKATRARS